MIIVSLEISLSRFFFFLENLIVGLLCLHVCQTIMCVPGACKSQKGALDPLGTGVMASCEQLCGC